MSTQHFLLATLLAVGSLTACDDDDDGGGSANTPDAETTADMETGDAPDMGEETPEPDAGEMPAPDAGEMPEPDAGTPPVGDGTANVLCGYGEEGEQQLVYNHMNPMNGTTTPVDTTLAYNFTWSCDEMERTVTGNGVPNHVVTGGEFASQISAQTISFSMTLTPELTGQVTNVKEPGYALNSVKFDPATAGTCPDDATAVGDCDPGMGSDMWRMVATPGDTSPWQFGFGVDINDAHVQPGGQYHYHGNPVSLVEALNPDYETSMTLVGWATDGFPIYSMMGHSDPEDGGSAVEEMQSSWRTIETPQANRPSIEDFPLGHFESDWEYVEGSGDLDECNGRFAVTPEFPDGIYHYYITATYPFVQRCVKGTSAGGGGPGGGGPPGGGPPP
ncbi:MAG: YHYH protein [Bradymonadia bacterium]